MLVTIFSFYFTPPTICSYSLLKPKKIGLLHGLITISTKKTSQLGKEANQILRVLIWGYKLGPFFTTLIFDFTVQMLFKCLCLQTWQVNCLFHSYASSTRQGCLQGNGHRKECFTKCTLQWVEVRPMRRKSYQYPYHEEDGVLFQISPIYVTHFNILLFLFGACLLFATLD